MNRIHTILVVVVGSVLIKLVLHELYIFSQFLSAFTAAVAASTHVIAIVDAVILIISVD